MIVLIIIRSIISIIGGITMIKFVNILIIISIVVSGLNIASFNTISSENDVILRLSDDIMFSSPLFQKNDGFLQLRMPEQTSYLLSEGKPVLPLVSKTYHFPIGTKVDSVDVAIEYEEFSIDASIEPGPQPLPLQMDLMKDITIVSEPDQTIYQKNALFPENSFEVKRGIGLYNDEHVVYLIVYGYCQYNPVEQYIKVPKAMSIDISYSEPSQQYLTGSGFDMLIITDEGFVDQLQPLLEHKNTIGIQTMIVTVQDIEQNYNGRDAAEDVKLKIKDTLEQFGIKYVLLVGGHIGQTHDWYVPVRYSHNFDGAYSSKGIAYDPKYVSDLYYADVYKYSTGGQPLFEDWDKNGNSIFGEFNSIATGGIDEIDFYPDVYVGRLPVRYSWEVDTMVQKIITYETSADDSWFKKAIVSGGDTSAPARGAPAGTYEGELSTIRTAGYLEDAGFEVTKLFTSDGSFSKTDDFIQAVTEGAGLIHVAGHGSPIVWGNFLPDAQTEEEFVYGFTINDIRQFDNGDKLPIVNVGGCHNGQFNVTMQNIFDHGGMSFDRAGFGEWVPHDTCSWFLLEPNGGAIVTIGNTALGYGYINQYVLEGLSGWLNPRLFHAYAVQGKEFIGDAHGQAIVDYINQLGSFIDDVNQDSVDRKTIEEWVLLGDPSLKIGGYSSAPSTTVDEGSDAPVPSTLGDVSVPVWQEGMSWTYEINDFDMHISEIASRALSVSFETGEIQFTVNEVTANEYLTTVNTFGLGAFLDLHIDLQSELFPIIKGKIKLQNASVIGNISFTKNNLAISSVDLILTGALDTETILGNVNFSVPPFVLNLFPAIPIQADIAIDFEHPFELLQFPLSLKKEWPMLENNITISGTIESPYFTMIHLVNKITKLFGFRLIPQMLEPFFPVIDIVEILESYNMTNSFELPEVGELFKKAPFICKTEETIETTAGEFTGYNIWLINGAGELCYSPETQNIVKIQANINDYIPIVDNLCIELVDYSI